MLLYIDIVPNLKCSSTPFVAMLYPVAIAFTISLLILLLFRRCFLRAPYSIPFADHPIPWVGTMYALWADCTDFLRVAR